MNKMSVSLIQQKYLQLVHARTVIHMLKTQAVPCLGHRSLNVEITAPKTVASETTKMRLLFEQHDAEHMVRVLLDSYALMEKELLAWFAVWNLELDDLDDLDDADEVSEVTTGL